MGKVIALIDSDPRLRELCTKLEESNSRYEQQLSFIKKQKEDLDKKHDAERLKLFEPIEAYLKEKDLLKDYDEKEQFLCCHMDQNAICIHNHSETNDHPLTILRKLFT